MSVLTVGKKQKRPPKKACSEQDRWAAVVARDTSADGQFVFGVKTTGVYCRPGCPSRIPLRKNVQFFKSCTEAELAGFQPCKRCKPNEAALEAKHAAIVEQACRRIEKSAESLPLKELATAAGISPFHFHRIFKLHTGITPKAYSAAHRATRVRHAITYRKKLPDAIYAAGYQSNGRFYADAEKTLGMSPSSFRAKGAGMTIEFAIGQSSLGPVLVAATQKGICAILIGDDTAQLERDLRRQFANAEVSRSGREFRKMIAKVIAFVEVPKRRFDLPLDIVGTAFQQRIWKALQQIAPGSTTTYSELARKLGIPKTTRAVANACAANPIAVAIPCHRVVCNDGALAGYRWGIERKAKLLERESAKATR